MNYDNIMHKYHNLLGECWDVYNRTTKVFDTELLLKRWDYDETSMLSRTPK